MPDVGRRLVWCVDDPARTPGEEEQLAVYRRVRDELRARIGADLFSEPRGH